jgi:hypothetical protein
MNGQASVLTAQAVAGFDLFSQQTFRTAGRDRQLQGIAFAGSVAAGDAWFELYIDNYHVGRFYNSAAGWPLRDHIIPCKGNRIPAGSTLSAVMGVNAGAGNINVIVY